MNVLLAAAQKLGYRQSAYRSAFPEGSATNLVLIDLAKHSRAFDEDVDGLSELAWARMVGRRDMFFRIVKHLKLSPTELEDVYRPALLGAAARLQRTQGDDDNG
jgi:hypothetical protein